MSTPQKVQMTLSVSPELDATLARLAVAIAGTKSEVLRKAIALMQVAVDGKQKGQDLWLTGPGSATEIVGICNEIQS